MKIKAFTLAEVLITLGIIGVIAAFTIPTLLANYKKEQTVVQLKKAYSELSQAAQLSVAQNGDIKNWDYTLSSNKFFNKYFLDFIKIDTQSLYNVYQKGITYKSLNGKIERNYTPLHNSAQIVTLASGTQIFLDSTPIKTTLYRKTLLIDLNGFKGPNKFGVDVFVFGITPDGVLPHQWDDGEPYNIRRDRNALRGGSGQNYRCHKSGRGMWCAALIMKDGWKIKSDYPW